MGFPYRIVNRIPWLFILVIRNMKGLMPVLLAAFLGWANQKKAAISAASQEFRGASLAGVAPICNL
jgi:hypothetical protein